MGDLAMWDVQFTRAPTVQGRTWRENRRVSVVCTTIQRAIELAMAQGEEVEVHQVIKRSAGEVVIDLGEEI